MKEKLIGSTKNIYTDPEHPGHLFFDFSDRVSVFDYGALQDSIPEKGRSLKKQAFHFYTLLEEEGLKTVFDAELSEKTGKVAQLRAEHPRVEGGDSDLEFLPLEVIFRWGAPKGSSLLKRRTELRPGAKLDNVLVEYSTKLEDQDRIVDASEAASLAGGEYKLQAIQVFAIRTAKILKTHLENMGLFLWDGKLELAYHKKEKEIYLVDAITLDELRVTLPGLDSLPLSKELLRRWLGATTWAWKLKKAKKDNPESWRESIPKPPRLGAWRTEKFSQLYMAFAQSLEAGSAEPLMNWARKDSTPPKVYVHGKGGRETAERWRLKQEGCVLVGSMEEADCVWISQDAHLEEGLVDQLEEKSLWAFGPTRKASEVEWSKEFGRRLALEAGLVCPRFSQNAEDLDSFEKIPVIKKDGLAAGKGVYLPSTKAEAVEIISDLQSEGSEFLLEERCEGFEASAFFGVTTGDEGAELRYLGCAQDFKRRYEGDEGLNTGGMGAYCPHPKVTDEDIALFKVWAQSTVDTLARWDRPYNGILYLGLMKDPQKGWVLIEYNARFGDPETQALVCSWSEKPILRGCLQLDLKTEIRDAQFQNPALCLALVRPEYPKPAPKDFSLPPWKLSAMGPVQLFLSESLSGRVAYLVGTGTTLQEAGDELYAQLVESPWKELLEWRADILL